MPDDKPVSRIRTRTGIHVYSAEKPDIPGADFRSFSDGWYTFTGTADARKARAMSKKTDCPVLFFVFSDFDTVYLNFYKNGKTVAGISTDAFIGSKGTSQIPGLVGYGGPGVQKRISDILKCTDSARLIALLEEYLGLTLLPPENDGDPEPPRRERGDALYRSYRAELDRTRGKAAPVKAVLVKEFPGKVFIQPVKADRYLPRYKYLFGYDRPGNSTLTCVEFVDGDLVPSSYDASELNELPNIGSSSVNIIDWRDQSPPTGVNETLPGENRTIRFNSNAPEPFKDRTVAVPRGYFSIGFDGRGHLMFTDYKRHLCITDADGNIISRISIKGDPQDFRDGYLMTAGFGSEWLHEYSPTDYIRIYRLEYSEG